MDILTILAAATTAYIFGAIWYTLFSKPWMAALGFTEADFKPEGKQNPIPFIIAAVCVIVVAAMMQYLFNRLGIYTNVLDGLIHGLAIGLFIVFPWVVTNYAYSLRSRTLALIDGGYIVGGSALIGLVLTLL